MKDILVFLTSLKPSQLEGFRKALALDRAQYAVRTIDTVRASLDSTLAIGPLRASELFDILDDVGHAMVAQKELECSCGVSTYEHAEGQSIEDLLARIARGEITLVVFDAPEEEMKASEPTVQ